MNLTSLETIKSLCSKYNIRPNRRAGQNFLINQSVVDKMIEAADLKKTDTVLEIGPGFGVLTKELALRVKKVIAVELDKRIVTALEKTLGAHKNIEIINTDILRIECFSVIPAKLVLDSPHESGDRGAGIQKEEQKIDSRFRGNDKEGVGNDKERIFRNLRSYKIVASLPYNITSAVLRKFLTEEPKPSEIILLVQKEVAERIVAKPGEMSLLAVSVQFYSRPEIVAIVSKTNFWPEPKVDSAIIKLKIKSEKFSPKADLRQRTDTAPLAEKAVEDKNFFQIAKIGFSARRKQLQNNLSAGLKIPKEEAKKILEKAGFDPKIRAQDLSVEDWIKLL